MAGTYTDRDALKDHKRLINKAKERIKALKADISKDMEMIKDKEEKIKTANDDKPKHAGMKNQKQMYADNIAKLKDRVKETQRIIKEVEAEVKDRMKKHKEAEADVKRIEANKSGKSESRVNEKMKMSDIAKQQLERYKERRKESEEMIKKQEDRIKANMENSKDDHKITDPRRKADRKKQVDTNLKNAKFIIKREKEFLSKILPEKIKAAEERLKNYLEDERSGKSESFSKGNKLAQQLMSVVESLNANDELEKKPVGVVEDEDEDDEDHEYDSEYDYEREDDDSEEDGEEEPAAVDDLTDTPDVEDEEDEINDSEEEDEDDKEPVVLENDEEDDKEEVDLTNEDDDSEDDSEEETNEDDDSEEDKEDEKNEEGEYPEDEEELDKDQLQENVKEFNAFRRSLTRLSEVKVNEDDTSKKKKATLRAKVEKAKDLVRKLRDKMRAYDKNAKAIRAKKKGVKRTPAQIKKDKEWSSQVAAQSSKMRAAWYTAKEYLADFEDQLENA